MIFADLDLAKRLERAEGYACAQFAEARKRLYPTSGSEWTEIAGAYVVFDGVDSPTTQTFGLGLFEEMNAPALARIEKFFLDRGAQVNHEVSPLVGPLALDLLCSRNYRPIEVSNALYRLVENPTAQRPTNIRVHITGREEAELWGSVSTRGWTFEHPELGEFMEQAAILCAARANCFLAELDGEPAAAGVLSLHEGVALFGGSTTVPEHRCRGLQGALLEERMRYAFEQGCDLAMMVAEAGSNSQRNAERKGFRVAYTRMKWQLARA